MFELLTLQRYEPKVTYPSGPKGTRNNKADWQKKQIRRMYFDLKGPINAEFRVHAVEKTGLPWQRIYKYIFDWSQRFKSMPNKAPLHIRSTYQSRTSNQIFKITKVKRY